MSASRQVESIRTGLAYTGLGFGGLALGAPRVFAGVYGLKGDGNLTAMIRLWGTRNLLLGALMMFAADDEQRRNLAAATAAVSVTDTVVIASAGADVSARARVMGVATTIAVGAAAAYVVSQT